MCGIKCRQRQRDFLFATQNNQRDIYNLWEDGAPHKQKRRKKEILEETKKPPELLVTGLDF